MRLTVTIIGSLLFGAMLAWCVPHGHAATAVITADSCAGWSWSPSALTLTCVPAGTQPPIVPPVQPPITPPGTWNGTCPAGFAGNVNGFDRVLLYQWDWANTPSKLDTAAMSGLGTNGILVVAFVATPPNDQTPNLASSSATGYPAPNLGNYITLAVSATPCDLSPPSPGQSSSTTPTVQYGVGAVPVSWATHKPTAVALTAGVRYYLNVANRDSAGNNTCVSLPAGWNCDVRLSIEKPPWH